MSHFDEIKSDLADGAYQRLERDQAEALVDALVMASAADGEVGERERNELDRSLSEIEKRAAGMPDDYPSRARERAREAAGDPEAIGRLAEQVAERLDDETLIDEAYYLSARVAAIDVDVRSTETEVLETFVETFDIPRDRLKLLTRRLRHEV